MRFRRDMQHFVGMVGVVVEPKAVRAEEGVSSFEGSVYNVRIGPSPSENENRPSMSTNSNLPFAHPALR